MKKKILLMFLAACMVVNPVVIGLDAVPVEAEITHISKDYTEGESGGFQYTAYQQGDVYITGYTGTVK